MTSHLSKFLIWDWVVILRLAYLVLGSRRWNGPKNGLHPILGACYTIEVALWAQKYALFLSSQPGLYYAGCKKENNKSNTSFTIYIYI